MTERTSREKATRMHYAAQFLDSENATVDMQRLARDYIALLDEHERMRARAARLEGALRVVIAEAGAIWDDSNPVAPAHGSHLDTMLFEAKSALHATTDAPGADGEVER